MVSSPMLSPDNSSSVLGNDPAAVVSNSKKLQKLSLMQVVANTVIDNLNEICNSDLNDRLLQKSMVGNLHQWLN